jgi:predicted nucleotidyltransferase
MTFNREKLENIVRKHGILMILLFGSRAKGNYSLKSDLDLGVLFNDDNFDQTALIADLMAVFPNYTLDLAILNHSDPVFKFEIISNYQILFCAAPEIFIGFYTNTVKQYNDVQKFLLQEDIFIKKYLGGATFEARKCDPPQIGLPG